MKQEEKVTKMIIRQAAMGEYPAVRAFYHAIIDAVTDPLSSVQWIKDVYPSPEFLIASIEAGDLYVAAEKDSVIASMVLNHQCNEGYRKFKWPTEAEENEVTVIHALGVHPSYTRKGCGRQMIQFAVEEARKNSQKALRLDVRKGNIAAEGLYASMGFQKLYTLPMFYEDTGWTDFELYEYQL